MRSLRQKSNPSLSMNLSKRQSLNSKRRNNQSMLISLLLVKELLKAVEITTVMVAQKLSNRTRLKIRSQAEKRRAKTRGRLKPLVMVVRKARSQVMIGRVSSHLREIMSQVVKVVDQEQQAVTRVTITREATHSQRARRPTTIPTMIEETTGILLRANRTINRLLLERSSPQISLLPTVRMIVVVKSRIIIKATIRVIQEARCSKPSAVKLHLLQVKEIKIHQALRTLPQQETRQRVMPR